MPFEDIINAKLSKEKDRPLMKKEIFAVSQGLTKYLQKHGREIKLPINYKDLLNYRFTTTLKDTQKRDTLWETVTYDFKEMEWLNTALLETYAMIKTKGDLRFITNLKIDRIDFCEYGNSVPFRIRVINKANDNFDYYYVKMTDASRIYGLELEHLLSPNRITFLHDKTTLVEEHIPGIPGDVFLKDYLQKPEINKIRLAKEFVKFNELCFTRLLGDMRSYNFVINIIPDIEESHYRIRAIDFDQQSYEGKRNLYLPQFFKENYDFVEMVLQNLTPESIFQYQTEERTATAYRLIASRYRLMDLLNIMTKDELSENYKVKILNDELNDYYKTLEFASCKTMGSITKRQLKKVLQTHLQQIQKEIGKFRD